MTTNLATPLTSINTIEQRQSQLENHQIWFSNYEYLKNYFSVKDFNHTFIQPLDSDNGLLNQSKYSNIINLKTTLEEGNDKLNIRALIEKLSLLPGFVQYEGAKKLSEDLDFYLTHESEYRAIDLERFLRSQFFDKTDNRLKIPTELYDTRNFFDQNSMPNQKMLVQQLKFLMTYKYSYEGLRQMGSRIGIISVDLNNLKEVNDFLGSALGDQLIGLVGKYLQTISKKYGFELASRSGGDEYDMLIIFENGDGLNNQNTLARIAREIFEDVTSNLVVDNFIAQSGKNPSQIQEIIKAKTGRDIDLSSLLNNRFVFSFGVGHAMLSSVINNYQIKDFLPANINEEELIAKLLDLTKAQADSIIKRDKPMYKNAILDKFPYMAPFFLIRTEDKKENPNFGKSYNQLQEKLKYMHRKEIFYEHMNLMRKINAVLSDMDRVQQKRGYFSSELKILSTIYEESISLNALYMEALGSLRNNYLKDTNN